MIVKGIHEKPLDERRRRISLHTGAVNWFVEGGG
jgi:hypothetical protein